jgi:MFS family permease
MVSLIAASFSTKVWHLIVTQGLLYGIGFLVLYYVLLSMLNEWFVARRGLAYGLMFAAAGVSGTGLPFLTEVCLEKFGYSNTLRGTAVAILVLVGPTLPFCRGRLPAADYPKVSKIDFKNILRNPIFYVFSLSNLFQGLAFYLPGIYLAIYANSMHISSIKSVLLLCLLNLSTVVGQIGLGWLSDCANIFVLLTGSALLSAIFGFFLWFFASSFGYLAFFAICFGLFAGGYTVLTTRFCSACVSDPPTVLWLYGIFAFGRGIGNVVAGPLSGEILNFIDRKMGNTHDPMSLRYLIVFVSVCMLLSSLGGLGYIWRDRALGLDSTIVGQQSMIELLGSTQMKSNSAQGYSKPSHGYSMPKRGHSTRLLYSKSEISRPLTWQETSAR